MDESAALGMVRDAPTGLCSLPPGGSGPTERRPLPRGWFPRDLTKDGAWWTERGRACGDAAIAVADALTQVRRDLRERLLQRVDARGLATAPRTERRVRVREQALAILRAEGHILPQRDLARVVNEVSDEVVGFGPIEFLLKDPEVTEVMGS